MRRFKPGESLSGDDQEGLAALLARKAQEDATAVREFGGNSEIADGIIGFHAQQAVEKWLKAVMAQRSIAQPRIHDIGRLLQLLREEGIPLPVDADRLDELTIYAVPLRYDDLLDAEPLDREDTMRLVEQTEAWARDALGSA
ncbi:MAG TPA: HEPN domain-containing protein [Solirubrobacterales bacterium]|nr:HEPN domain-containing protein [Solirubrobacterales bacterium]